VDDTLAKLAAVPGALVAQSDMIRATSAMMHEKAETILQMIPPANATVAEKKRIRNQQANKRKKIRQRITTDDYYQYYSQPNHH
jgi:hypothetical protein